MNDGQQSSIIFKLISNTDILRVLFGSSVCIFAVDSKGSSRVVFEEKDFS